MGADLDPESAQRVVIFGNSGSGKSTLAARLRREQGLAHLDLDTIAWSPEAEAPTRRPLSESAALVERFLERESRWVVEGCYSDLLELVAPLAEELIFLNPGVATCQENCRRRPWEPHKYATPEDQDAKLEFLLGWVAQYEERRDEFSLAAHRKLFDRHEGPKRELSSNTP